MGFREAVRHWANKPSRRERREKEEKNKEQLAKANEESAQVRALKRQITVLEDLLDKSYAQIEAQAKVISNHREGAWMDRVIDKGLDIVDNMFGSKPIDITPKRKIFTSPSPSVEETEIQATAETKDASIEGSYSSEQIQELVSRFDIEQVKKASKAPYFLFSKKLKNYYPNASKENILEAYNLVQERAENGK